MGRSAGRLITVSPDERKEIRKRREARDLSQRELASRVGTTAATISNIETGRHPQVQRDVYAALLRVLFKDSQVPSDPDRSEEAFRTIVQGFLELDERDQGTVSALVEALLKKQPAR